MISAVVGAFALALQAAEPVDPATASPAPATPVSATPVSGATVKAPKPADPSQQVVCKNEVIVGSMIPKRVCLTRESWAAMTSAGKEVTQDIQTGALQRPSRDMALGH